MKRKKDFFESFKKDIETLNVLQKNLNENLRKAFEELGKEVVKAKKEGSEMILPEHLREMVEVLVPLYEAPKKKNKRRKKETNQH